MQYADIVFDTNPVIFVHLNHSELIYIMENVHQLWTWFFYRIHCT